MSLKIHDIKDRCTGCGACASICPKGALSISYDDEGFYYPHLDSELCIDCKACENVCHAINVYTPDVPSINYKAYMCKSLDRNIVMKSSSGGVFTVLSNYVLERGGVIYGARYNYEKELLEHCSSDTCSMDELRKAKYIESFTGTIFKNVAQDLNKGREVLFCGTPCQLAGLTVFLNKRHIPLDNLIRVRFICHGVPSNRFFTEYKHFEEKRWGGKLTKFDFRPKTHGWSMSDQRMSFDNGKENMPLFSHYFYYYYYYYFCLPNNDLLRKSCYQCGHLKHELSDFTLGDFWGIVYHDPGRKKTEKEGLSLVLAHTEKAKNFISNLSDSCEIEELPFSTVQYIYKDAEEKKHLLHERSKKMERVKKYGYMHVAKDTLKYRIIKNKFKGLLGYLKRKIIHQ